MIDLKTWGEWMFAYWKYIKKYHSNETDNFDDCVKEGSKLMDQFPQPIFRSMVFAFLEQKSIESIRKSN